VPHEHDWAESGLDRAQIRAVYPNDISKQNVAIEKGLQAACRIVTSNRATVEALSEALVKNGVYMPGSEVEGMVDSHLLTNDKNHASLYARRKM
jgi:hypothetical protein